MRCGEPGAPIVPRVSAVWLTFNHISITHVIKGCNTIVGQEERLAIVKALGCVDEAFYEESLDLKCEYVRQVRATSRLIPRHLDISTSSLYSSRRHT